MVLILCRQWHDHFAAPNVIINKRLATGLLLDPLGDLTAIPKTPPGYRGCPVKGKEGREVKGRGKVGLEKMGWARE